MMSSTDAFLIGAAIRALAENRRDFAIGSCPAEWLRHAVDVGLGPALYRITDDTERGAWQPVLQAQDLTARIETLNRHEALEQILRAAPRELTGRLILLKGISLGQRLYPSPQLRMMGDIDLLTEPPLQPVLEQVLSGLGYEQRSPQPQSFYAQHHHSMPFRHPRTQIIVEVHTALFRPDTALGQVVLFDPARLFARSITEEFRGFGVRHLDAETELAYLAAHWINERRCFGTAVIPVMDLAMYLRQLPPDFRWSRFLDALSDTAVAPHVRVAFSYLTHQAVATVPEDVLSRLQRLSSRPGPGVDRRLHRLIDCHAMSGRPFGSLRTQHLVNVIWETLLAPRPSWFNLAMIPWNLVFPPGQVHRFSPWFQAQRIWSVLRRGTLRSS